MYLGLDQLILTVADLPAAAADFAKLGFCVVERPDVAKPATVSRFIPFADRAYIMLQHVRPEAAARHRLARALELGEGWADYAIWTDDVRADLARLAAAGLQPVGPHSALQPRSDGKAWAVDLLMLGRGAGAAASAALPFLAEDRADRTLRVPRLPEGKHPNGAVGIEGITVACREARAVERKLSVIFGASRELPPLHDGASRRWRYEIGSQWVDLLEAAESASSLAGHLKRRGDGVYEVSLRCDSPAGGRLLDPGLSHGARLRLV